MVKKRIRRRRSNLGRLNSKVSKVLGVRMKNPSELEEIETRAISEEELLETASSYSLALASEILASPEASEEQKEAAENLVDSICELDDVLGFDVIEVLEEQE